MDNAEAVLDRIEVTVNGEVHSIPARESVAGLLSLLNLPHDRVAIELNRTIVRKRDWDQTVIPAASRIEIVEFVGGG